MPARSATPAPRGRGARRDILRDILEAAVALFADLPYAEVRVDAIAARARVAKPTLYRYVTTKEALFIEALAFTLAEIKGELAGLRAPSPEARLRRAVAIVLERVGRLSPAIQAVEGHGSELGERSRRVLREGFAGLTDELGRILADGARTGDFAPDLDPGLAVLMILGTVRMAAHAGANGIGAVGSVGAGTGAEVGADALADLFLGGLRADRASSRRHLALGAVA